ncbi:MAG: hypothetical protein ACTHWW_02755 [Arthrobacter sp.]|uniref:hypothetical protein n=1 Tax=unclassified Arthrobacter TaxID=235627 RepID=UPI00264AD099|nr:hypothetical protein [Micrococcaceae bacterium]MDN5822976.1 hypothetical protein [Micrococcaceae bacterium]MDN5878558.1 hypothetical protein [Micrococcaceae bacterium]MDN5886781.1 hypothetical protein [Micrococcaceae bacterium]MDN5904477.1 hypothetical protein [Micrococcaceae bacterium]
MFGSIGQPVSGAKNDQTARMFLKYLRDQDPDHASTQRRRKRQRQRFYRRVKGWFTSD